MITTKDLMEHNFFRVNHGVAAFTYWAIKIETLRGLGDIDGADSLMYEASRYWNNKYMMDSYEKIFLRSVCYYHYHMLKGDVTKAYEISENTRIITSRGILPL